MLFLHPSKYFQNQHKTHFASCAGNCAYAGAPVGWVHLSAWDYNRCSATEEQELISLIMGKEGMLEGKIKGTKNQCIWHLPYEALGINQELNVFCVYLYKYKCFKYEILEKIC